MRVSKLHKKLFNEFDEGKFCLINSEFFHQTRSRLRNASHGLLIAPQRIIVPTLAQATVL